MGGVKCRYILCQLRVKQIKSNLRKRARKEVAPVPAIYSETLVELSTQPDCSEVASSLPTFSSFNVAGNRTFCLVLVFLLYCLTIRKTFNYCNTQFMLQGLDILSLDILGLDIWSLDILVLDIWSLDILGLDILSLDILGLDILDILGMILLATFYLKRGYRCI